MSLLSIIERVTRNIVRVGYAAIALLILSPLLLWILGYKINAHSDELAKIAAQRKDVMLCTKIINIGILGPSTGESRMHCIKRYAEYTKDPSACELLMPSSYGWSCLGAAEEPNTRQCWFDFGSTPPQVGHGKSVVTLPECASNPKSMQQNRCCELAETLYVDKESNCDALKQPTFLHDQCLELMAKRDRNLVLCSQIQNENVRSGCEVAVRTLQYKNLSELE